MELHKVNKKQYSVKIMTFFLLLLLLLAYLVFLLNITKAVIVQNCKKSQPCCFLGKVAIVFIIHCISDNQKDSKQFLFYSDVGTFGGEFVRFITV